MLDSVNNLDIILGNNAGDYTTEQKEWALNAAKYEVEAYIGRDVELAAYNYATATEGSAPVKSSISNDALYSAILDIAVIKLYRLGTEAVASQSFSGVSESFLSGYPAHITAILNRYRRIKVIG